MTHAASAKTRENQPERRSWWQQWNAIPLYLRILGALVLGCVLGVVLGERAQTLEIPAKVILQLLSAIAPPLVLVAIVHALINSELPAGSAGRLAWLLLLNTTVAIFIGLLVANLIQPGTWSQLSQPEQPQEEKKLDPVDTVLKNIPKSVLGPLGDQTNVIGVIILAIAFGLALRQLQNKAVGELVEVAYQALSVVLHWIISIVPIGVLAIVSFVVGTKGFQPFQAMGMFILAVLVALLLQSLWYLVRIQFFSWPRPLAVLRGMRDALLMAFSTASSTATMPVTYKCLREKVGLREDSASLGSLVGANFNNDGTALYEAIAALFVAQLIGRDLTLYQQFLVVLTSVFASVGAAGIPEAGLVTMTLVFHAVGLPTEYIALLLAVDWFLDRCRTTINVLGDVNVSCMLEGKTEKLASSKAK